MSDSKFTVEEEATTFERMEAETEGGCSEPGCGCKAGPLYLASNCHPEVPLLVSYERGTGVLVVECAKCHQIVDRFLLAHSSKVN